MQQYFSCLRRHIGENTDKSGAVKALRDGISGCLFPFKTVAERFHLIDEASCTVYIPLDEGAQLCEKLLSRRAGKQDYRRAGQYGVSIFEHHYRALLSAGDITPLDESSAVLVNLNLYDPQKGLSLQAENGKADFI